MNAVAFFCDRHMVPGLHAALASLLSCWAKSASLEVYIFADRLSKRDEMLILATAGRFAGPQVRVQLKRYTPEAPPGSRLLYGSATLFGRLSLAELLPGIDQCLYLDCDVVVEMDLAGTDLMAADGSAVQADGTGTRSTAFERELYREAGLDLGGPCFNSGVLGLNLRRWREEGSRSRCLEVSARFQGDRRLTDQAMLNVAFAKTFRALGDRINTQLYPSTQCLGAMGGERIFHFAGSPKPWDLMGRVAHLNHGLWQKWARKTAWWNFRSRLSPLLFARRNLLVAGAILRAIRAKQSK